MITRKGAIPMPPEVCCISSKALIDYVLRRKGEEARDRLVAGVVDNERFHIVDKLDPSKVGPVELKHLLDPDYWVSNELSLQLFENAVTVLGGARPLFLAGMAFVHEQAAFRRFFAVIRLIPTRYTFFRVQKENRKGNRLKVVELIRNTRGHAVFEFRYHEGVRVTRDICEWNLGIYVGAAQVTGCSDVQIRETTCVTEGAPACRFELTYRPPSLVERLRGFVVYLLGRDFIASFDQQRLEKEELVMNLEQKVAARTEALRASEETYRRLAVDLEERNKELGAANRDLKTTQEQLFHAEKLATLGTLAGGVAHEINNPLCYLLGNLEIVSKKLPDLLAAVQPPSELDDPVTAGRVARIRAELSAPEAQADLIASIDDSLHGGRRIRDIVRDLRTFAERRPGEVELVDVGRVITDALQMVDHEINQRARLRQEYGATPPVIADPGQLGQAFVNLLVNAAQAITHGDIIDNEIWVVTRTDGAAVVVEIGDTGDGIAPEIRSRIFDPFFTTRPPGKQAGLGLSTTHTIISAYGGSIDVESEPGGGSRFFVRLPAAIETRAAAPSPPTPFAHEDAGDHSGRILVVDDEQQVAEMISRMLSPLHQVSVATSGFEAQRLIHEESFDLIFSDLLMPNVSGPELYEWVTKERPELAPRMVFMTGAAFTEQAKSFVGSVSNRCLHKPLERDAVRLLVQQVLAETGATNRS